MDAYPRLRRKGCWARGCGGSDDCRDDTRRGCARRGCAGGGGGDARRSGGGTDGQRRSCPGAQRLSAPRSLGFGL